MTRQIRISDDIRRKQALAADPEASVWVAANAGSGKTHVLTERVLRLLLSGVQPESILCLTYTKAAAAEMRKRVSERLAKWALMDDQELQKALLEAEDRPPAPIRLMRARTLFAHALETPGGLKINTIHAFCESVLHRFPLEAHVPIDFSVVEEAEQAEMLRHARESVLADGLDGNSEESAAVAALFRLMSDDAIEKAISAALGQARRLRPLLADRGGAKSRLRRLVGLRAGETAEAILRQVTDQSLFPPARWPGLFAHLPPDPAKTQRLNFCERLYRLHGRPFDARDLFDAWLKDGEPYKDRCVAGIKDEMLAEAVGAEHDRLAGLYARYRLTLLVERSDAVLDVLASIISRYEAQKRARSLLDFDDLVARTRALFARSEARDWVRYKLDAGIGHILVDESQDTNPEQWRIVEDLAEEFFTGESAIQRERTLFAVGDEKQSIYSFQGAEPRLFGTTGGRFAMRASQAEKTWHKLVLKASFRTLKGILEAVDRVCEDDGIAKALLAMSKEVSHESARAEDGGSVTLWPPVEQEEVVLAGDRWPAPDDLKAYRDASKVVAERIAGAVAKWIRDKRPLGARGRPVRADDVLILVQSRNALFKQIIRSLKLRQIPTPGADRLPVTTHIAVLDLMALADVLINPADDLQLAALLRSPLFDIDEELLLEIGHPRHGTLWQALGRAQAAPAVEAYQRLHRWRGRLDYDRPYDFFAEVLYAEGGLKRFHARLGPEVDDVLAEFLDLALAHERSTQPSLQGFLAELRRSDISIKRDLPESGGGVRVMTVHGAKGLEAPIVILADAASKPQAQQLGKPLYVLDEAPGPLLVHASARKDHVPETLGLREADEENLRQEYWRKLYVAMTRAEDELYVTGVLGRQGKDRAKKLESTWYGAIETALKAEASPCAVPGEEGLPGLVFPAGQPAAKMARAVESAAVVDRKPLTLAPLPPVAPREIVRPSGLHEGYDGQSVFDTGAEALLDADLSRKRGIALHALLQHLTRIAPEDRPRIADKALGVLLPALPEMHAGLAAKALSILSRPDLAHLFGAASRAEVPFEATATREGKPVTIAGRMDRLVLTPETALVVDFKSDANPAAAPEQVPQGYLAQLGLYSRVLKKMFPERHIEAAILWTGTETLQRLPQKLLLDATMAFTLP